MRGWSIKNCLLSNELKSGFFFSFLQQKFSGTVVAITVALNPNRMNRSKTITTVLAGAVVGAVTFIGVSPIKSMVHKARVSKTAKTVPVAKKDDDVHFFI